MNKLTRKIRNKGYTLQQFCDSIGYSLRWYRTHCGQGNKQSAAIEAHINNLEDK